MNINEAYLLGQDAFNEYKRSGIYSGNPFDEGTDEFNDWNEGWNSKELN